jgi:uncharacterized repeat protein (TIGR01451 family)
VTIATSAASVPSAQQLTYTMSVKNNGSQPANNVKLYNTLGLDLTVLEMSATKANGRTARCDLSADNDAVCDMDRVPADPNVSAQLQIDVVVDGPLGTLVETSTVHSNTSDTDTSDNSGSANNQVTGRLEGVTITTTDHVAYEADSSNKGQFSVCRYETRPTALVVNFQTAVTPTPTDHQPLGSWVTIGAGAQCGTITVTVTPDTRDEGPEFVAVTLAAGNGYTVDPRKATAEVGIVDAQRSRPIVTITATDPTASESGDNTGKFTVTRTTSFHSSLTVFLTASGTATVAPGAAADVQQTAAFSVQIPASFGPTSVEITVRPVQDSAPEGAEGETLVLTIDERATYQVGTPGSATVTIADDDIGRPDLLSIKAIDPEASETPPAIPPDTGTFEIERLNDQTTLTVNYTVRNSPGDATPGLDYQSIGTQVQIPAGEFRWPITVIPNDDSYSEPIEPVVVTLSASYGQYDVATNRATVLICDDESAGGVRVRRVTHNGGSRGITAGTRVTFTAVLSPSSASVPGGAYTWEFAELLSVRGRTRDYAPFAVVAGNGSKTFTTSVEKSGQYRVTLACGNPSAAVSVTVLPKITIDDVTVVEGNSGSKDATFTVSLSGPSTERVTVKYKTVDGSAKAPADYTAKPLTLISFAPGVTTQKVTVAVQGDIETEPTEDFYVDLSDATKSVIADGRGVATILTDEPPPEISIDDTIVAEGDSGTTKATLTVSLSSASTQIVTVEYKTTNGTAIAPGDYTAKPLTALVFDPGITTQVVEVVVQRDTVPEPDEQFYVDLSNPTNATVSDSRGVVTIVDDDHGAKLKEVAFSGPAYHVVIADDGSETYYAPHWLDDNLDGDADDPGERKWPVSFTRNTTMYASVKLVMNEPLSGSETILVRGDGPGNLDFPPTPATAIGTEIIVTDIAAANPFLDEIDIFEPMRIIWQVSVGAGPWISAGVSQNEVYVTLGNPEGTLYHTTVYLGSKNADGQKDRDDTIAKIWEEFTDRKVESKTKGKLLKYYGDWTTKNTTAAGLLKDADGQCSAWSNFFILMLKNQGLLGQDDPSAMNNAVGVSPTPFPAELGGKDDVFLIKEWAFARAGLSGDGFRPFLNIPEGDLFPPNGGVDEWSYKDNDSYNWRYAQVTDKDGKPGQGTNNPRSDFGNHQFVVLKDRNERRTYYDPSYGVTYTSVEDFETRMIAGYVQGARNYNVSETVVRADLNGNGNMTDQLIFDVLLIRGPRLAWEVSRVQSGTGTWPGE